MLDQLSNPALAESKAAQYAQSKGWTFRVANDQLNLEVCPICSKSNWHFYQAFKGNKDGLWECKKCQASGTLYELMVKLGDRDPSMQSQKDWAGAKEKHEQLPNYEACHELLMSEQGNDAVDYLTDVRGFSLDVIVKMKLGLMPKRYFRDLGREARSIVIPYLKNGRIVFTKYRSFTPDPKAFSSPTGWEPPLYNEEVIQPGVPDLVFFEGEYDALSAMTNGIERVLGVPGAAMKKSTWVDLIDAANPGRVYICFDGDKAGQDGAQELAERIGIDRCFSIVLPAFEWEDDENNVHKGKDINDWFKHGGGTVEAFEELKKTARKFDVRGVKSVGAVLDELEENLEGKEFERPKYQTRYKELNAKIGGFEDGDVIDILAPGKVGKTTVALALLDELVEDYEENAMFICGEMTNARMGRKWLCKVTLTDDSPAKTDDEARDKANRLRAAIPRAKSILQKRRGDIYFCNPDIRELDELYELMKQARRRYGIKFFGVDNLQLFCDMTLRNQAHRTIHMSQFSKKLAKLNKDMGSVLFRIVQPKKMNGNSIASQDDIDGASQIDKDCDMLISLHRNRKADISAQDFEAGGNYMDEEDAFEPEMLFTARMTRYAPGGKTTLKYNGGTSSISSVEFNKVQAVIAAKAASPYDLPQEKPSDPSAAGALAEELEEEPIGI